jgi:PDZ domain
MNNEQENLSRNDEKLRGILGSLDKVDAPKHFNFRLKSKIASAETNGGNRTFWRYLLIGTSSLTGILLVAFFAFNRNVPTQIATFNQPQPPTVGTPEIKVLPEVAKVETSEKTQIETPTSKKDSRLIEPKIVADKVLAKAEKLQNIEVESKRILPKKSVVKDNFVGEKTSAFTGIKKPLVPKGFGSTSVNTQLNDITTVFEIESLLSDLGIETTAENGKLKVKSVKKNSSAERSGVKNDDVIDAVDNQKITPKETRQKAFTAKSLNITREGKTLELKLQN